MPLDRLADKLDISIEEQRRLVEEVRSLRTSTRRLTTIAALLGVLVIAVGVLGLYGWSIARNVDEVVADAAVAREEQRLDACQRRNSAQEVGRDTSLRSDIQAVESSFEVVADLNPDNRTMIAGLVDQIVKDLEESAPAAADLISVDTDCNQNGKLDGGDYFDQRPEHLPVSISQDQ